MCLDVKGRGQVGGPHKRARTEARRTGRRWSGFPTTLVTAAPKCVPSQHWSLRIGQSENSTLWCAWVIASDERTYFFGGDTGYFHGFTEIGKRYGPIDVALVPIGAYEPRWFMRYSHMNPAEAYQAFLDLGAQWMIPCHWGTFDLTDEPYDEPPRKLRQVVQAAGDSLDPIKIMAIGERWEVPE